MARPTETEKLLASIEKEMKEQNQRLINLDEASVQGIERETRRPVKSVKPNLFVTGKRASQSDYISARGAIATEKYTKAYLKDLKKTAEETKKSKGVNKKEKEKAEKVAEERHKEILSASEKLVELTEDEAARGETQEENRIRLKERALVKHQKQLAKEKKQKIADEKKNRSFLVKMIAEPFEEKIESMEEGLVGFARDTVKLDVKTRKEKEEAMAEQTAAWNEKAEELAEIPYKKMTYGDKLIWDVLKHNQFSTENLTQDILDAINNMSHRAEVASADFEIKFGKTMAKSQADFAEGLKKIDSKDLDAINDYRAKYAEEFKAWERANDEITNIQHGLANYFNENGIAKDIGKVVNSSFDRLIGERQDLIERNLRTIYSSTYEKEKKDREKHEKKSTELATEANKITNKQLLLTHQTNDVAEQTNQLAVTANDIAIKQLESEEERASDEKADKRDNVLKEADKIARDESIADSLETIAENSEKDDKCCDGQSGGLKTGAKTDSGGGFLSSLMAMVGLKWLLPKILKFGPIAKVLTKLGGFGKMVTKFGGIVSKLSLGGMALGALGGDGLMDTLFGGMFGGDDDDGAKTKTKTKSKSPKGKRGLFSKVWGGIKSAGSFVKQKAFGLAPKLVEGASKIGGKTIAKTVGKSALKKVPILGALAGGGFAVDRAMKGDWLGAGGELLSGILGATGFGIPASLGLDAWLATRDASDNKPKTKQIQKPTSKKKGVLGSIMGAAKFAFPALALSSLIPSFLGGSSDTEIKKKEILSNVQSQTLRPNSVTPLSAKSNVVVQSAPGTVTDRTVAKENTLLEILSVLKTTDARTQQMLTEQEQQRRDEARLARTKSDAAKAAENGKVKDESLWDKVLDFFGIGDKKKKGKNSKVNGVYTSGANGGGSWGGTPNNAPLGTGVGALVSKYETSGRGAGMVSSGKGDAGGISYGTYQMSTAKGTAQKFVQNSKFADEFKGLKAGTSAFSQKWKQMASGDRAQEFSDAQDQYANNKYFAPANAKIKNSTGLDVTTRSTALQAALMSTAIQHGVGGANSIWSKAVQAAGGANASDADIINAVYNERGAPGRFKSSSKAVQASVHNRFINEKKDALAMLNRGKSTPSLPTQNGVGVASAVSPVKTASSTISQTQTGVGIGARPNIQVKGQTGTQTGVGSGALVDNARASIGNGMTYSQSNRGLDQANPRSMDCSSWVARMVQKTFGIGSNIFGSSTVPQFDYLQQNGTPIPLGQEAPGDFACYGNRSTRHRHIAIVSGRGKQIHMSSHYNGVVESNISPTLYGGARIFRLTNIATTAPSSSVSAATNAMTSASGGAGGAGGGGMGGSTGAGMVDGSITAIGTGSSSNTLNGVLKSGMAKATPGNLKGLESLPFQNLLSSIAGGRGAFNKSFLNSQNMISSGLESIRGAIPNTVGQYPGGQIPFSGKIEDDSLKFLSGFFAGK